MNGVTAKSGWCLGAMLGWLVCSALPAAAAVPLAEGYEPTGFEQYMVELINRARADPDAEAARFGIDLNEGLEPGTLTSEPRQPVAIHTTCVRAARDHTLDVVTNIHDLPADHRGSDGRTLTQRLGDLGIVYTGASENNSWSSGSTLTAALVDKLHGLLFKDFTASFEVVGRGHRLVILRNERNMVGVGVLTGIIQGRMAGVCTQDYITHAGPYLTGVVFSDLNGNAFYTPGEGLQGVTIEAVSAGGKDTFVTTTFLSGGYTLGVPPGTYTVSAYGGPLPEALTRTDVVVSDRNVKVDFSPDPPITPPPEPVYELLSGSCKLGKDGVWGLAVKSMRFNPGARALSADQLDEFHILVAGLEFFDKATRDLSKVKVGIDPETGGVCKLAVADPSKNKLTMDLLKRTLKLTIVRLPGFDPGAGPFPIVVHFGSGYATLTTTAQVVKKKAVLAPATGDVITVE